MSPTPDFVLSATEFDLLYAGLGLGPVPLPLEVPSVGATFEERDRMTGEMYQDLARRGLADGQRLDADLEDLLRVLGESTVSVYAVGYAGKPLQALVATDRRAAVLAEMVEDGVGLTSIRPTALAKSIVDLIPAAEAGPLRTMSLPYEPVTRALDPDDDLDDPFGNDLDDEAALIRAGVPAKDAAALIELAEGRTAGGQFGVSTGSTRVQPPVTWFDTPHGRYLMINDGAWMSIAPADQQRIADRIDSILSTLDELAPR